MSSHTTPPCFSGTTATTIQRHVFPNGTTVLVDRAPSFHSVSFGVCAVGGSQEERPEVVGITHLVEHLLFKRTHQKSTREIAYAIDDLGGDLNAFTDTDSLCLYGSVPNYLLQGGIELIAELLFDGAFTESDLGLEREIIRQEILESEEVASDLTYQRFCSHFWAGSMLAYPVFGTRTSLEQMDYTTVKDRLRELLTGKRLIIGVVGDVTLDQVVPLLEARFGALPAGERPLPLEPEQHFGSFHAPSKSSQTVLMLGRGWPGMHHDDYLLGLVVAAALGQGSSSRLFQKIREEHALTYDIDVTVDSYPKSGAMVISGAFEHDHVQEALTLIQGELSALREHSLEPKEFLRTVNSLSAQIHMEGDNLRGRLWRLIDSEQYFGRYVGWDEVQRRFLALRYEDLPQFFERWLEPERELLILGGEANSGEE